MPRSLSRNTLICLTFAALLNPAAVFGAPGPAQRDRQAGQTTAVPARTDPAGVWKWLRTALDAASCILDPSDSQRRRGRPRPDVGCILDPDGRCHVG
jgi:hypothetical protein